jgi:Spx/MgsR family transcriptional regulator
MIKIYGIKSCGSVKKAFNFLDAHNLKYEFTDFKKEPVGCDKVKSWLEKTDIKILLNTKGTTYKKLQLKELNLNDEEKAQWLCKENLLVKRPVIECNGKLLVGYDEELYKEVLL